MNARRPPSRPQQSRKPRRSHSEPRETRPAERRSVRPEPRHKTAEISAPENRKISLQFLILFLSVVAAFIIVLPTFTRYIGQKQELRNLNSELTSVKQHNEELQKELNLWNDDDYVRTQARARLGYVLPGQTLYVVTDASRGSAKEQLQAKVDSVNRERRAATPWFSTLWDSVVIAGNSGGADNPNNVPIIPQDSQLKDSQND